MVTQETQEFLDRFRPPEGSLRHVFLYCSWQLVWWLSLSFWGASTPPFISKEGEVIRKVTESVTT
jgi:hypothetical protein